MDEPDRIESWKQIAAYLGKSERTVRRWQQVEGLPVHRHVHQQRGSVWAYKTEIDQWLATRKESPEPLIEVPEPPARSRRPWLAAAALAVSLAALGIALWPRRPAPAPAASAPPIPDPEVLTALPGAAYGPAFSPDGRRVAFYWSPGKADPGIYLKEIGSEAATPLATGRDYIYSPAWSPDGKTVAYLRRVFPPGAGFAMYSPGNETWLCLVDATGGPERRLARLATAVLFYGNHMHLSWSTDGQRILAPMAEGGRRGIHWIPVNGGEPSQVTTAQTDHDWAPQLAPDGRALVYMRQQGPAQAAIETLYRQDLGPDGGPRGDPRILYRSRSMTSGVAWLSSSKDIVFCRADSALFGPFNSRLFRMPVDGSSEPVALGLGHCTTVAAHRAGSLLAYGSGDHTRCRLWSAPLSTLGDAAGFAASSRFDGMPNHSPDGSQVAFVSNRTGKPELWIAAADGSNAKRLTENAHVSSVPQWSPDGSRIVYGASTPPRPGEAASANRLRIVAVTGGAQTEVALGSQQASDPSWSADGRDLYYWSGQQLWRSHADGSRAAMLREYPSHWLRSSGKLWRKGGETLYVAAGKPFALLRADPEVDRETVLVDGLSTPFVATTRRFVYFIKSPGPDLYAMPIEGGPERRVGRLPSGEARRIVLGLSVAPDDSRVVWAITDEQRSDLMLVRDFR